MGKKTGLQIINLLGFLVMIAANAAANLVPLNNLTTGAVSDSYPNLFAPAGFTFAIWGLIYILLLAFIVYQARDLFSANKQEMPFLQSIGPLFFFSSILNAGWIFAWHYLQIALSMVIMVALLLCLIKIYLNLDVGRKEVSKKEYFLVYLPFQVYLGWITIATIANATALLVDLGWGRFGLSEVFWTVAMIAAAVIITLAFLRLRRDVVIALVSIWSLVGILVKRLETEPVEMTIVIGAIAAVIIIAIFAAFNIPKSLKVYTDG